MADELFSFLSTYEWTSRVAPRQNLDRTEIGDLRSSFIPSAECRERLGGTLNHYYREAA
jgi:hypothetical protein